jgi:hypothetical protein
MISTGRQQAPIANSESGDKMTNSEFQMRILQELEKLNKRLFQDNGETCMQSKVNKNALYIKWMAGIVSAVGLVCLGLFIKQNLGG